MTNKRNNSKEDVGRGSPNKKSRKKLANSGQPQDPSLPGTSSSTGVAKTVKKSVDVEAGSLNKKSMEALANSGSPAPPSLAGPSSSTGIAEGLKTSVDVEAGSSNKKSGKTPANNDELQPKSQAGKSSSKGGTLGLKSALHGTIYQLKLLMLFLVRGIDAKYEFQLATEREDLGGKFDDIIFKYDDYEDDGRRTVYRYAQAKHRQSEYEKINGKEKKKQITASQLIKETNGDFSLLKYFSSYATIRAMLLNNVIKEYLEDCNICTNIGFNEGNCQKYGIELEAIKESDKVFEFPTLPVAHRYKIKVTENHRVGMEFYEKCRKIKIKDPDTEIDRYATNQDVMDFLNKLVFVQTPNEVVLGKLITEKIRNRCNLNEADLQSDFLLRNILDWFKTKESEFMPSEEANKIFSDCDEKIESLCVTSASIDYQMELQETIEFNENAITKMTINLEKLLLLSNENKRIITKYPKSTAVKVNAALKKIENIEKIKKFEKYDSYLMASAKNVEATSAKYKNAFKSQTCQLFVVVCEGGDAENDSYYENLIGVSQTQTSNKKVIILCRNGDGIPDACKFSELSESCKNKILDKEISFQGMHRTVRNLVEKGNEENVLDAKAIEELLEVKEIKIP